MIKKRYISVLFFSMIFPAMVNSVSVYDIPDYITSREMEAAASRAYQDGRYQDAIEYAQLAAAYGEKVSLYLEYITAQQTAMNTLHLVRGQLRHIAGFGGDKSSPQQYAQAEELLSQAEQVFEQENFSRATELGRNALAALEGISRIEFIPSDIYPSRYIVRLRPGDRESLWKIAGYDFIYNDPFKWPFIYENNKHALPDPNNPHLIHPGTVLEILPLGDEVREGVR